MSTFEIIAGILAIPLTLVPPALGTPTLGVVLGWLLFAGGSLAAVRNASPRRAGRVHRIAGSSMRLAAISAGLGLVLGPVYPDFALSFCIPYTGLALAAAVVGHAAGAAHAPASEE
jgi:uncharacterized membrane protein HdeD (DUF308 family)